MMFVTISTLNLFIESSNIVSDCILEIKKPLMNLSIKFQSMFFKVTLVYKYVYIYSFRPGLMIWFQFQNAFYFTCPVSELLPFSAQSVNSLIFPTDISSFHLNISITFLSCKQPFSIVVYVIRVMHDLVKVFGHQSKTVFFQIIKDLVKIKL